MKTWQSILLGFIIGGVLFAALIISIGFNIVNKIEDNYSDEYTTAKNLVTEASPAVIQPNYLLAGLTLSPKFQDFLELEMENGVWNTEYVLQVLADDVIPIYDENLIPIIALSATKHIDEIENATVKVKGAKSKLDSLIANIKFKISVIKEKDIKSKLGSLIANIKSKVSVIKGKVSDILNDVNSLNIPGIKNEINNIVREVKSLIETIKGTTSDEVKDKIISAIKNSPYADDLKKILSDVLDIVSNIEGSLDYILKQINTTISILLTDKDTNGKIFNGGDNVPGVGTLTDLEAQILNAIDINIYGEYTKKNMISGNIDIKAIDITFENVDFGISVSTDKLLTDIENGVSGTVAKVIYSSRGSADGVLSLGLIYYNEIDNS